MEKLNIGLKKRLIALIVSLSLIFSFIACSLSVKAEEYTTQSNYNNYPLVFVHGMMGWGAYEPFDYLIDYFGLGSGSVSLDLNITGRGPVYEASVGPMSSSWDRACELYAQLTGTRVDYGADHAAKYGHSRYGRNYRGRALIPNFQWNEFNKINLVGHSFGATTIRVLLDMLKDGRPDEVAACQANGTEVSPLFTGGKSSYVQSITTIAGTNNGTTFCYGFPLLTNLSFTVFQSVLHVAGMLNLPMIHDFQLDQFFLGSNPGLSSITTIGAILNNPQWLAHNDNALAECYVDRAVDLNKDLDLDPNVYYFCYSGASGFWSPLGTYRSTLKTFSILQPFVNRMGSYAGLTPGFYTDYYGRYATIKKTPRTYLDYKWWENDGFVNTSSEKTPFHYDEYGQVVFDNYTEYDNDDVFYPGQWYVMPTKQSDHFGIIGGVFNENPLETHWFYHWIADNIRKTYRY